MIQTLNDVNVNAHTQAETEAEPETDAEHSQTPPQKLLQTPSRRVSLSQPRDSESVLD